MGESEGRGEGGVGTKERGRGERVKQRREGESTYLPARVRTLGTSDLLCLWLFHLEHYSTVRASAPAKERMGHHIISESQIEIAGIGHGVFL